LATILEYNAFCARSIPASWLLEGAPPRIASILGVPVVSIFLQDPDSGCLVMRSSAGFAAVAPGAVRLQPGEGITGLSFATGQVIAAQQASEHPCFQAVAGLDEAQFPVFAATPMMGDAGALGVLVVERERAEFSEQELIVLASLAGSLALALLASDPNAPQGRQSNRRRAGGGTRRVILPGRTAVAGRALGPLAAVRRPPRRAAAFQADNPGRSLLDAFTTAERVVRELTTKAAEAQLGDSASFLDVYLQILGDARFKARSLELVTRGVAASEALGQLAGEAVRTATRWTRSMFLEDRARDMEDLCDAIAMLAVSDPRAAMPSRSIVMSDALSVYDLMVTSRSRPVGIALTERAGGPRTRVLLQLLSLPAILDVGGLFRQASDGDIALLDATHGLLLINPSRAEVAELRQSLERSSAP
jgi:phosphotransferase system, enzyme I, PtsP